VASSAGPDEVGAVDVEGLVAAIDEGRDDIVVPQELVTETEADAAVGTPGARAATILARLRFLTVAERIKLALRGNKEARTLLLRDSNRIIVRLVLKNPRITEDEIVAVTRNRSVDEELLREIAERREWTRNYQIRLGLVSNPKTSPAAAVRLIGLLEERDIARLAKSKNVPDVVVAAARRLLFTRQQRGRS
jgi:hypothetical protein